MKEKRTVGSPFFGAFPSDRIRKTMTDVNVHSFIHRFIFRDELLLDNALTVKKNFGINFPLPLSIGNFLLRDGGDDFHKEDVVYFVDRIRSTIFHPLLL